MPLPSQQQSRLQLKLLPRRPLATCPDECIVGPTEIELSSTSKFISWGYNNNNNNNGNQRVTTKTTPTTTSGTNEDLFSTRKRKYENKGDDDDDDDTVDNNQGTDSSSSSSSFQKAIDTFLVNGCCVIPPTTTTTNVPVQVLPSSFIQLCLSRATQDYIYLTKLVQKERHRILCNGNKKTTGNQSHQNQDQHHQLAALSRQDYAELCARDGGRIDIRYHMNDYPYNCGGLIYNSIVFPLVKALLTTGTSTNVNEDTDTDEPIQLLYAGIMWGMPTTTTTTTTTATTTTTTDDDDNDSNASCHQHQKWHADGGHLFSPDQLPPGLTLPPHCINVFYPLVDLTKENGPTEFRIGSHRREDTDSKNNADAASTTKSPMDIEFPLLCPAGGAILFDYRIQHRGRANISVPPLSTSTPPSLPTPLESTTNGEGKDGIQQGRPILYVAYAKTFFKDHGNTRSGRRLVDTDTTTQTTTQSTHTKSSSSSSVWATRTLTGRPVPYGKGFENYNTNNNDNDNDKKDDDTTTNNNDTSNTNTKVKNNTVKNTDISSAAAAAAAAACTITTSNGTKDTDDNTDSNQNNNNNDDSDHDHSVIAETTTATASATGVGERWILFQMTIEIPDTTTNDHENDHGENEHEHEHETKNGSSSSGTSSTRTKSETIHIHNGDLAGEVAQQFVYQHHLHEDFIPILTHTIQQQINECTSTSSTAT